MYEILFRDKNRLLQKVTGWGIERVNFSEGDSINGLWIVLFKIKSFWSSDSFGSRIKGQAITPIASSLAEISCGHPTDFAHATLQSLRDFLNACIESFIIVRDWHCSRRVLFGVAVIRQRCKSTMSTVAALRWIEKPQVTFGACTRCLLGLRWVGGLRRNSFLSGFSGYKSFGWLRRSSNRVRTHTGACFWTL